MKMYIASLIPQKQTISREKGEIEMSNQAGGEMEVEEPIESAEQDARDQHPLLYSVTSQTPWWIVSILLHGLVITLAGLISLAIELPTGDDDLVMISVIEERRPMDLPIQVVNPVQRNVDLLNVNPVESTDPNSTVIENVAIDEAIKDIAQLGEDWRNIGPEHIEKEGAYGLQTNTFFREKGSIETDGGGGNDGIAMADMIGAGGSTSKGTGGGKGGGNGTGWGQGDGPGMGTKGWPDRSSRHVIIKRFKAPTGTLASTDLGLKWLAYHQEADGRWDAMKYGASVKTDTAVTGMALLAFLGAGHTERVGEYKVNVQRAVAWLKSKQAADGSIWDTSDDSAHHRKIGYPNAIATLAMAEAAGMGNVPETKNAAQKAIDYATEIHQCGEGYEKSGWRYAAKEAGDLSVTGWYVMALKSAKIAGLKVPASAFDGAIRFLDSVEVKEGGDAYAASRYKYTSNNEHSHTAHRLGAIGNLSRQFLGWKKEDLQSSVEWFVNKGGVPTYGANGEAVDLYYWYYGMMCVFQQQDKALWDRWKDTMKPVIIDNQCVKGDEAGSWNPVGAYSGEWGRVGQTALNALCLEVFYRYQLIKN
jgi:hypothetical protein